MLSGLFSSLAFVTPQALWALIVLPFFWILFKATPPAPKPLQIPTARFLRNLHVDDSSKASLPWWIKLLRVFTIALLIFAASQPYQKPENSLTIEGESIGIIIENDWAAAPHIQKQKRKALELISYAKRQNKTVLVIQTTKTHKDPKYLSLFTAREAELYIQNLTVRPWKSKFSDILPVLQDQKGVVEKVSHFHWLGHGYDSGSIDVVFKYLGNFASITYYQDTIDKNALILRAEGHKNIRISGYTANHAPNLKLYALDKHGQILNHIILKNVKNNENINIESIWDTLSPNDPAPAYIQLGEYAYAGSVWVLPNNITRQRIGILGNAGNIDRNRSPLVQPIYYLSKIFEDKMPYTIGTLQELIDWSSKLIIVPEDHKLSQQDAEKLELWVESGGTLLRFPDTNTANKAVQHSNLLPVEILQNERSISGRLDWQAPLSLGNLPETSPFHGMHIDDSLAIKKQILTVPGRGSLAQSWAVSSDGTPLVTSKEVSLGRIVFIHTALNPEWSNIALTPFLLNMMHRTADLASGSIYRSSKNIDDVQGKETIITPITHLNGAGRLISVEPDAQPITLENAEKLNYDHNFLPGVYRSNNAEYIYNLGYKVRAPIQVSLGDHLVKRASYQSESSLNLTVPLITLAIFCFLIEWFFTARLTGFALINVSKPLLRASVILALITAFSNEHAYAQTSNDEAAKANQLNLAYIKTYNPVVDAMAQRGLEYVAEQLNKRTALKGTKVQAVDVEKASLSFYPLLYWPIYNEKSTFSDAFYSKLNEYLEYDGMLFIDLRTGRKLESIYTANKSVLNEIGNKVYIPELSPLPESHVLRKSYYLLGGETPSGRYTTGSLWLDHDNTENSQYVATTILGSNDWIGILSDTRSDPYKRERALRFMINVVMYALTGTYKQDQVHTKAILERLEKRDKVIRLRK